MGCRVFGSQCFELGVEKPRVGGAAWDVKVGLGSIKLHALGLIIGLETGPSPEALGSLGL